MPSRLPRVALLVAAMTLAAAPAAAKDPSASDRADHALQHFVRVVLAANPQVQAARAALETSAALRDAAARPLYNPEIDVEVERSADDARTLGVSQTLDWHGKRAARSDAAERERQLAVAHYTSTVWGIGRELLTELSRHQVAAARQALAARSEGVMSEFAKLAEQRFSAGDLTRTELSLARLSLTDARIQHATRSGEAVAARQQLSALAVDVPAVQWPALASPPAPARSVSSDDRAALLHALPEVIAAQRQVDLADAQVALRRREQRPDPTLSLRGGEQANQSLVGIGISIPLFVRNRFDDEVRAALSERDEARFGADAAWRQAQARLQGADERYALLYTAWSEWEQTGQPSLEMQADQLRRLWQVGELGTTDYLFQIRQTFAVQDNALQLRLALWEGWFEWLRASGRIGDWIGFDALPTGQRGER